MDDSILSNSNINAPNEKLTSGIIRYNKITKLLFENLITGCIKRTHYKAPQSLFNYRKQALNGIWKARKAAAAIENEMQSHKSKDQPKVPQELDDLDSDLTLLLLFPLIGQVRH